MARRNALIDGGGDSYTTLISGTSTTATTVTGPTATTATGPIATTATGPTAAQKFGIIEALLFDPKYGKPNQKGGLWEVFDVYTREKNPGKADDLFNATAWAKLDTDVQERYLTRLENEPLYKEKRNEWLVNVKRYLLRNNIKVDDETLFDYYDRGIENEVILDELIGKQTGATGFGADDRERLRQIAYDNGFDLEKDFGGEVNGWLQSIARGESIDNFARIIRQRAAQNQPEYVKSLLTAGRDLRNVYGFYLNTLANYLDVDPETIKLDDPLLRSVFTNKGGISTNEFLNLIRQDPRYGKTAAAGGEKDLRQSIADRALELGVRLEDTAIDEIFNTALSLGLRSLTPQVDALIRSKFSYVPGTTPAGVAGTYLDDLRETAMANGIDLDKQFGTQLQDWLRNILAGESVDTYKRQIRQIAGNGMPDNIKKLLDSGTDLLTIYSPYRSLMSSILEVNPQSINLNDPLLRSAIGPEGEVSLYDFQRSLRKDPRWQYTNNAREEVSNSVLSVLRDFGFQG